MPIYLHSFGKKVSKHHCELTTTKVDLPDGVVVAVVCFAAGVAA